jgi:hypothetical protein
MKVIEDRIVQTELKPNKASEAGVRELAGIWGRMNTQERRELFQGVRHYLNVAGHKGIAQTLSNPDITSIQFGANLILSRASGDNLASVTTVYFTGYDDCYYRGRACDWVNLFEAFARKGGYSIEWQDPSLLSKPLNTFMVNR